MEKSKKVFLKVVDDKNDDYIFKNIKIISSHSDNINHLMKLNDGRFASCSDDCTLNI